MIEIPLVGDPLDMFDPEDPDPNAYFEDDDDITVPSADDANDWEDEEADVDVYEDWPGY